MGDSDNITRGKKRQNKDDGKKTNTNTLVKGLKKKHTDTKLDAIKDQDRVTKKNKKFVKRIKTDALTKSRCRSNQVHYDLNNSTVAQLDDLPKLPIKKGSRYDKKSNSGHNKEKRINQDW